MCALHQICFHWERDFWENAPPKRARKRGSGIKSKRRHSARAISEIENVFAARYNRTESGASASTRMHFIHFNMSCSSRIPENECKTDPPTSRQIEIYPSQRMHTFIFRSHSPRFLFPLRPFISGYLLLIAEFRIASKNFGPKINCILPTKSTENEFICVC